MRKCKPWVPEPATPEWLSANFMRPLINVQRSPISGLSLPSAYKLVNELENLGVLKEITGAKRGKQYWFQEYIELFK